MTLVKRLVKGSRLTHAELDGNFDHLMAEISKVAAPTSPTGVAFSTAPGTPTVTNTGITETASVVNNNGTPVNIPSLLMPYSLAAAGKKRRDAIVVDYAAASPTYVRIAGTEVNSTDVVPTPSIPVNRLFVRYLDITDGAATAYQSELAAVNTALSGKMDKAPTVVTDWLTYKDRGPVEGEGPGGGMVSGWGNTHIGGKINTMYLVASHVAPYQQYTRYVQRDSAMVVEADSGWITLGLKELPVNTQAVSYTLELNDRSVLVNMESASPCTVTIPPDSAVDFPIGTQIPIDWGNAAGQPTIVAGSGVTVQSEGSKFKISAQFNGIIAHKIGANTWRIKGGLSA